MASIEYNDTIRTVAIDFHRILFPTPVIKRSRVGKIEYFMRVILYYILHSFFLHISSLNHEAPTGMESNNFKPSIALIIGNDTKCHFARYISWNTEGIGLSLSLIQRPHQLLT